MPKQIDATDIYDKALTIVSESLDGKFYDYDTKFAAFELLKPIMQAIWLERTRGGWSSTIDDEPAGKE